MQEHCSNLKLLFFLMRPRFLETSFKCVYNEGRKSPLSFLTQNAANYVQKPDVLGISLLECSTLCAKRGPGLCNSFGYKPTTQTCYTKNVNSNITGYLCGISYEVARNFCQSSGQTYVAFGGVNQTMMECVCGGFVEGGKWKISSLIRYDCIDACQAKRPCTIQNGLLASCQLCDGLPTDCNYVPHVDNELFRALCTTL